MFGESRSESPRLPSPWQQALATTRNVTVTSESPLQRESPQVVPIGVRPPSQFSRPPSSLSLGAGGPIDLDPDIASPFRSRSDSADSRLDLSGEDDIEEPQSWRHSGQNLIISPDEHGLTKLPAERDAVGHIEYKLKLIAPGPERFDRLTTQLKWRLTEGGGEAMYEIGVLDDGTLVGISRAEMEASLKTLELMAAELGATVMVLRTITIVTPVTSPNSYSRFGSGLLPPNISTFLTSNGSGSSTQADVLASGSSGIPQTKQDKKQQKRARLAERKLQAVQMERTSYSTLTQQKDCASDTDEPCVETALSPSDIKLGKQADVMPEEEGDVGISIADSWRARNIERARHDRLWRSNGHAREPHASAFLSEEDFHLRTERKWKGKRPWRRKQGSEGDSSSPSSEAKVDDGDFLFNLEGMDLELESKAAQPLTHDALKALQEGPFPDFPPPKIPSKRLQHNREKKSRRKEERRLELLRGDGAAEAPVDVPYDSSDSDPDFVIKNLLQRMIFSPSALPTMVSPSRVTADDVVTLPATSPSGKTLRAPSPRSGALFSLTGPRIDPALQPVPSPTDTITQPLDSLSLSFAHSEVVPQNGAIENGHDSISATLLAGRGASDSDHICVEALVIKKMDADEPFGFLDFGSVGLDC